MLAFVFFTGCHAGRDFQLLGITAQLRRLYVNQVAGEMVAYFSRGQDRFSRRLKRQKRGDGVFVTAKIDHTIPSMYETSRFPAARQLAISRQQISSKQQVLARMAMHVWDAFWLTYLLFPNLQNLLQQISETKRIFYLIQHHLSLQIAQLFF
jgi:hypothetical protein